MQHFVKFCILAQTWESITKRFPVFPFEGPRPTRWWVNFLMVLIFAKVNNAEVHFWLSPRQIGIAKKRHFSEFPPEFQLFAVLLVDALWTPRQSLIYPAFLFLFRMVNEAFCLLPSIITLKCGLCTSNMSIHWLFVECRIKGPKLYFLNFSTIPRWFNVHEIWKHVALEPKLISTQLHNSFFLKINQRTHYVLALARYWSHTTEPTQEQGATCLKSFWNETSYRLTRSGSDWATDKSARRNVRTALLRLAEGCGTMGRAQLAWPVEEDFTKEATLRLHVEGWVRAGWVVRQADPTASQGTGMMDIRARGGLSCFWLEAQTLLAPWESSPYLMPCQHSLQGRGQTIAPTWAPPPSKTCGLDDDFAVSKI